MKIFHKVLLLALLLAVSVSGESASAQGTSAATPSTDFLFTRNLSLGIRGNDVFVLQQFLIAGEFLKITTPTGYFGPSTKAAVILWQRAVGITPPSGFFGVLSRGKMNTPVKSAPVIVTAASSTLATTTALMTKNGSPVRLKIPKFNIDAAFQYNGLTSLGVMEIPNNVTDAGWYTGSPRPGEKGVAIVTGHVAQIHGGVVTKLGVFARLRELLPGDTLAITDDRGITTTFIVREIRTYDPAADAHDVFTSDDDGSHLRLITCEGVWEVGKQSYTKRLVVFADTVK